MYRVHGGFIARFYCNLSPLQDLFHFKILLQSHFVERPLRWLVWVMKTNLLLQYFFFSFYDSKTRRYLLPLLRLLEWFKWKETFIARVIRWIEWIKNHHWKTLYCVAFFDWGHVWPSGQLRDLTVRRMLYPSWGNSFVISSCDVTCTGCMEISLQDFTVISHRCKTSFIARYYYNLTLLEDLCVGSYE